MTPGSQAAAGTSAHPYRVRAVDRALDLLAAFTDSRTELSLIQLTLQSGLAKPTVFRLLATLCERGFVEQSPGTRAYRLGAAYLARLADTNVVTHCQRTGFTASRTCTRRMREFADTTAAPVGLSVRVGDRRVLVAQAEPCVVPRSNANAAPGDSTDLLADAAGWLLLAAMGPDGADAYIDRHRCLTYDDASWPGREGMHERLAAIVRNGWSEGSGRAESGLEVVAAPVVDHRRHVVATLHTFASGHAAEVGAGLRAAVIAIAGSLSDDLGGRFLSDDDMNLPAGAAPGGPS